MAETSGDAAQGPRNPNVRKGVATVFVGTEAERQVPTGEHFCQASGSGKYTGAAWTPFGPDDAERERAKALGQPIPEPHYKKQDRFQKRQAQKAAERNGSAPAATGSPAAAPAGPMSPADVLAQRLKGFENDPEMRKLIYERWEAEQLAAAPPVATAAPAPVPAEIEA